MEKNYYHIHQLIDVIVDENVNIPVVDQIDFQIGYFKQDVPQSIAPHQINVKPYSVFSSDSYSPFDTFHLVRGVSGKLLDDPKSRVAIQNDKTGYTVYADNPFLINLFIQLLFIDIGVSLVHAAAVVDESNRATLFPGAGGVGKTALLGFLAKDHNYRLLGDDIIGLSAKGECLSFPRSFVLKEYHRTVYPDVFERFNISSVPQNKPMSFDSRDIKRFVKENIPFLGLSKSVLRQLGLLDTVSQKILGDQPRGQPFLAAVSIEDIFGYGAVADRGRVENIIFLQRYEGERFQVIPISESALCSRMIAIVHHEWVSVMRQFFTLGALEMVDLTQYFNTVRKIIQSAVHGKQNNMLLIPDQASPEELLHQFLLMSS
jgi:hypothetical protein